MSYVFGSYVLDTARRELSCTGASIPLEPKAYQILVHLIEHRDRLVTRAELLEHVWSDVYVDDSAVSRCIGAVRKAVGDSREREDVIQTRRGQGYRFVATVVVEDDMAMCPQTPEDPEASLPDVLQPVPAPLDDTEYCVHCSEVITIRAAYCPACAHPFAAVSAAGAEDVNGTAPSLSESANGSLCSVVCWISPRHLTSTLWMSW